MCVLRGKMYGDVMYWCREERREGEGREEKGKGGQRNGRGGKRREGKERGEEMKGITSCTPPSSSPFLSSPL
jgi:hypothetical protein